MQTTIEEDQLAAAEMALKRVFAALERERIEGVRYADALMLLGLLEIQDAVDILLLGHERLRAS